MAQLVRSLTGQSVKSFNEPVAPVLARMTTTDAQTGTLNHLSEAQEQKLQELKNKLKKDGWWSPDGVNGKPTHDDGTLLRYLRARKFDVQGAYGQFTDTEKWIKEQRVEELYEHFDVDLFEKTRRMYPAWTGHRDRRGIPIYVYEIQGLTSKAVSAYEKETAAYKATLAHHKDLATPAKHLPLFALYHNLLNFVLPLCSALERPHPEIPVTNSTNIVDIKGVSLRQFWNLKTHMQDASILATARYPETLDRIFIIGAPSFFPTVWSWIKGWFDPVTVSKIFILSREEVKSTLENFMDLKDIPEQYGGTLRWHWGDDPDLDGETREALERDGHKGWVRGPALWLEQRRVVVGAKDGKLRRSDQEVAAMKPIVYAADYTEEPVHKETRRLSVSSHKKPVIAHPKGPEHPSMDGAPRFPVSGGDTAPRTAAVEPPNATKPTTTATAKGPLNEPFVSRPPLPDHISPHAVRQSPMGDANVYLPNAQAAPPAQTAEYILPPTDPSTPQQRSSAAEAAASKTAMPSPDAQSVPPTQPVQTTSRPDAERPTHVSSHPASDTPSAHMVQMQRKVAQKLDGESIVVLPADSSHPEVVLASDMSKGLAIETNGRGSNDRTTIGSSRPVPERFVTAAEF